MKTKRMTSTIPTVLALLLALPLTAWAQDDDPFALEGVEEEAVDEQPVIEDEFRIGLYWLDDDPYRFGKYLGFTSDGAEALLDFKVGKRPQWDSGDTRRWSLEGWRLGLDSRRLEYQIADQGLQSFTASYRQIPNNRIFDGMTPYLGAGGSELTLPGSWAVTPGSSNTRGFANLYPSLVNLSVSTERDRMNATYTREISATWSFTVDYLHEAKQGTRTIGSIFGYTGGNPRGVILPAPVDYTTDTIELQFDFTTTRVQAGIGVFASFFDNDRTTLTWQNAFGQVGAWAPSVSYPGSQGRLALEPDNSHLQVKAWGGINLSPGSRLTADVAFGTMQQDDTLLPYSVNPNLVVHTPVPLQSLDAAINTRMANLRYTAQLARSLALAVNYRYDDRDNDTPREVYPYIGGDSQDQRPFDDGRINLPYSYTRHEADAITTLRLGGHARLKVGAEYADISRTYSEVTDSDEWTWLAGLRFNAWQTTGFSVEYRVSERDVDHYDDNAPHLLSHVPGTLPDDDWENHPLMRKYFLTGRDRDEVRARIDFYPVTSVNFGFSVSLFEDDYDEGFFGLNESEAQSLTADFGWYPRENVSLAGYYTREKYDASQSSRSFRNASMAADPANNWWVDSSDDVDTWNLSLTFSGIGGDGDSKGVELGFDVTRSDVASHFDVRVASGGTDPLPPLRTDLRSASAWARFAMGDRSSIRLSAEFSELDVDDWGLDGVVPDTLANVLTLGEGSGDYDLLLLWGSWTTRF